MRSTSIAEDLASGMLAHGGIAVLRDLQLAAATAKRNGKPEIAASLTEIAEAAERLLLHDVPRKAG